MLLQTKKSSLQSDSSDSDSISSTSDNLSDAEAEVLRNAEKIKSHVIEAQEMRSLCERKQQEAKETGDLPFPERIITVIGDYAQNLDLPHTGEEQPGETHCMSPVNMESDGAKGGRNVAS